MKNQQATLLMPAVLKFSKIIFPSIIHHNKLHEGLIEIWFVYPYKMK